MEVVFILSSLLHPLFYLLILAAFLIHRQYFFKKPPSKTLPTLRLEKMYYLVLFRNMARFSHLPASMILLKIMEAGCGLCKHFDKERIFRLFVNMKTYVIFFKPDTIEVVLNNSYAPDKAKEYRYLQPWLGTGLLTSSGKKWRYRRKLLTPSFHFKILEDFIPVFNEQSHILISKLRKLKPDSFVDIVPLLTSCTLDIICETAMGVSIKAQTGGCSEYAQAITDIGNSFLYRGLRPWLYIDFMFNLSPTGRKFNKDLVTVHSFTRKVIKEKKEEMINAGRICLDRRRSSSNIKRRTAFLEMLLKHHLKDPSFTEEGIQEEVDTFMFEGHDTTSMALSFSLYCIGLYENVQQKVHEELDDIFDGDTRREITRDDLANMKYLDCVIKEAQRLYPPLPFIAREVKERFNVLDYTVEPGSVCFIFLLVLLRDPVSFPDPEKFDPERFFPENVAKRHPYAYIPFSAGPRNCIGQKFALIEEKAVLANILRTFKITSKDPRDKVNISPSIVIRNVDPIYLSFTSRR